MGTPERPYRIDPPAPREERRGRTAKERSRNRLTINYISDGTPIPRCKLRPKDEQAEWVLEHRPYHVSEFFYHYFDECINAPTCEECRIYKKAKAMIESERFAAIEQLARDLLARLSQDYGDYEGEPDSEVSELFVRGDRLLPIADPIFTCEDCGRDTPIRMNGSCHHTVA